MNKDNNLLSANTEKTFCICKNDLYKNVYFKFLSISYLTYHSVSLT